MRPYDAMNGVVHSVTFLVCKCWEVKITDLVVPSDCSENWIGLQVRDLAIYILRFLYVRGIKIAVVRQSVDPLCPIVKKV